MESLPSLPSQKAFILKNAQVLDRPAQNAIYRLVKQAEGNNEEKAILVDRENKPHAVDLNRLGSPQTILQIYNIVKSQRDALSQPAKDLFF